MHLTQSFATPTHTHTSIPEWGEGAKLVYRHYATLFFILVVDDQESELGILDLIQGAAVTTIACQLSPFMLQRAHTARFLAVARIHYIAAASPFIESRIRVQCVRVCLFPL